VLEAARKPGALPGHDDVLVTADRDGKRTGLDPYHLAGAGYVRLAAERLAGHDLPAPQLGGPWRVGGAEYRPGAAGLALPQHAGGIADANGGRGADIDEQRGRYPEGVAEPGQRGEVRIRPALLECHEHTLAHAGPRGELVE